MVVAVRADFYARCAAYPALARLLARQPRARRPDAARRAAAGDRAAVAAGRAARRARARRAVAGGRRARAGCAAAALTALFELWERRDGRLLSLAGYERSGGVRGAVARLAETAYARLDPAQQAIARRILLRLAGEDAGGGAVRRRVALDELEADRDEAVGDVLDVLAASRLVTVSAGTAEVAHEALLREWPRLRDWLEEDAEGRRLHHHLATAAREWHAGGRDPGELFRGARLASTLDWAAGHAGDLNAVERAFVDAGRDQSEAEARRARRTNRRLRTLLGAVLALLALAGGAGALFLGQRDQARREARAADARHLGAQALVEPDLDRALLLARQGVALEDSVETRSNLLAALMRSPAAVAVSRVGHGRLNSMAMRPDGRVLVVGDEHGTVNFLDPATGRELRRPFDAQTLYIRQLVFNRERLAAAGRGLRRAPAARRAQLPRARRARGPGAGPPVHQRRVLAGRARARGDVRDR